jgi:hypothetical protein
LEILAWNGQSIGWIEQISEQHADDKWTVLMGNSVFMVLCSVLDCEDCKKVISIRNMELGDLESHVTVYSGK